MKQWLKENKIIVFIFLLVLIPRLIFMITAFFVLGDYRFVENQDGYLDVGLNLLINGLYGADGIPHSFPAPGYPIMIAISWLIIPKYVFIIFWHNIMYSVFIIFIYKFARLFFNNFVSLGAALLMAFEPFSVYWPNVVMSEVPFLMFFMISIYYLALFWQKEKWKFIIYSSVLLGLAALIRPIVFFFYPVIVISIIIMMWRRTGWLKLAKYSIAYLLIFLAVTSPWCIRNKIQFDSYTISNLPHYLYFLTTARDFLILNQGLSQAQADAYLQNLAVEKTGVDNFDQILYKDEYIPALKEITFSLIKSDPLNYLKWHLIKALPVLTDSGWINMLVFWKTDVANAQSISISNLIVQKDFQVLTSTFRENKFFLVRITGIIFWLFLNLIAFIGMILVLSRKDLFRIGLVMLAIIGYFVFASSWAALARLRLPFQPFLFIFISYAIYVFYLKFINYETR